MKNIFIVILFVYLFFRCCITFDCDVVLSISSLNPQNTETCDQIVGYTLDGHEMCNAQTYKFRCCPK